MEKIRGPWDNLEKIIVTRSYEVLISKADLERIDEDFQSSLIEAAARCADAGDLNGTLCWIQGKYDVVDAPFSRGDCWINSKDVCPDDIVLDHVYYEVEETDLVIE